MKRTLLTISYGIAAVFMLLAPSSCRLSAGKQAAGADTIVMAQAPTFDADSAYAYTDAQCSFGPRVPNSDAHRRCGDYIAAQFTRFGATVTNQYADLAAYDGTVLKARNIIASYNPEADIRILICGHWDSRPWADNDPDPANHRHPVLAANDAASDVAVMLEMARQIQLHPMNIGVDFICFDAEDYGQPQWDDKEYPSDGWCLGSQYWAENPHVYAYRARFGILMDMVGGQGAVFRKEGFSLNFASQVVDLVWKTAAQCGYGNYFSTEEGGYVTDDHLPVNRTAQIPCIDIIPHFTDGPSGFGPTWHTVEDDMQHIDKNVLKAVGQTVLQVIYNENR